MATYKEIKGVTIQTFSEDPVIGGIAGATWSSGGDVNTARASGGGAGTAQTEALLFGGSSGSNVANTEQSNGTSWTETADLNNARSLMGGTGTYTAALAAGGSSPGQYVETWNGSSWTETTDLNTARRGNNGLFGTQPAAIITGGYLPGGPGTAATEQWNGSSWTEVNDLNTARWALTTGGTTTAGIAAAGEVSPKGQTETWNGSSWTETTDLNTGRGEIGGSGGSSAQTALLIFGGGSSQTKTENWDGSAWTELNDLATYRGQLPKTNIANTSALAISGGTPGSPYNAATEHFSVAPPTAAILTEGSIFLSGGTTLKGFGKAAGVPAGTWASSTNINTARGLLGGVGTNTEGLIFGGFTHPPSAAYANTEQYNGTSWTELNDLNTARYYITKGGLGTVTAAITMGGEPVSGTPGQINESWNGSTWTEVNDTNNKIRKGSGAGTATAGLIFSDSGEGSTPKVKTESWDGTSWTETTDINSGRGDGCGTGIQTSALLVGGEEPAINGKTESWNGSAWTETGDLNTARRGLSGTGANNTNSLVFLGTPPLRSNTEAFNGTSWTELNDLSTAREGAAPGSNFGTMNSFAAGGYNGGTNAVEDWNVDATLSTVTFS